LKKLIFLIPLILISLLVLLVIINGQETSSPVTNKIQIVAAENFYGDIAKQIGGDKVNVISILSNPSQDPHEYEPTSQDAIKISEADIVVENGLGYDAFMDQLLSATKNINVINVGEFINLSKEDNPHLWYNTTYMKSYALKLEQELMNLDSENESAYQYNYSRFIDSLKTLEGFCGDIKNNFPGRKVIAVERVADYMLNNCGLDPIANGFQKAVEEGIDPSADSINFFENSLTSHQAKVLIYNDQTESETSQKMKNLADQYGIPVVGFTETMPLDTNYIDWMSDQLQTLLNALGNTVR